ncbi:MAG: WD40 repeat domain-containing protein [Chloroflexota bacterium]
MNQLTVVAEWGEGKARDVVIDTAEKQAAVIASSGIYVYALSNWRQIDFLPLGDTASQAVFSPDGRFLALIHPQKNQVWLWEVGRGATAVQTITAETQIWEIYFSPDGQFLLLNAQSGLTAYAWQSNGAQTPLLEKSSAGWISFNEASTLLAIPDLGAEPKQVSLWQLTLPTALQPVATLVSEPNMDLHFGRLSPDGTYYGGIVRDRMLEKDDMLFIWNVATAQIVSQIPIANLQLFDTQNSWAFSPNSARLAVLTANNQIEIFDLATGSATTAIPVAPGSQPSHVALTNTDAIIGDTNGAITLWNMAENRQVQHIQGNQARLFELHLLPSTTQFVAVSETGAITHYQLPDGAQIHSLTAHTTDTITDVTFAPDSASIAASFANGAVQVWQVNGVLQQTFSASSGNVDSVQFSPDGRFLATGVGQRAGAIAYDDTVAVWQLPDASLQAAAGGEKEDVPGCSFFRNNVLFTPDGQLVAAASHDFTVRLTQAADGQEVYAFPPHADAVLDLALSPDGRFLASASEDATVRVYDLQTYAQVHELTGSVGGFWSAVFSPDGRFLAAGNRFGELYIWELTSGTLVRQINGQQNKQSNLVFSPDGRMLAAGAEGEQINFWSVETGALITAMPAQTNFVRSIAFSPNGEFLISGGSDNILRLWQISS